MSRDELESNYGENVELQKLHKALTELDAVRQQVTQQQINNQPPNRKQYYLSLLKMYNLFRRYLKKYAPDVLKKEIYTWTHGGKEKTIRLKDLDQLKHRKITQKKKVQDWRGNTETKEMKTPVIPPVRAIEKAHQLIEETVVGMKLGIKQKQRVPRRTYDEDAKIGDILDKYGSIDTREIASENDD